MFTGTFRPYGIDTTGYIDSVKLTKRGPVYTFHYDHAPEKTWTATEAELKQIIGA